MASTRAPWLAAATGAAAVAVAAAAAVVVHVAACAVGADNERGTLQLGKRCLGYDIVRLISGSGPGLLLWCSRQVCKAHTRLMQAYDEYSIKPNIITASKCLTGPLFQLTCRGTLERYLLSAVRSAGSPALKRSVFSCIRESSTRRSSMYSSPRLCDRSSSARCAFSFKSA
jgi:hypothetical protein